MLHKKMLSYFNIAVYEGGVVINKEGVIINGAAGRLFKNLHAPFPEYIRKIPNENDYVPVNIAGKITDELYLTHNLEVLDDELNNTGLSFDMIKLKTGAFVYQSPLIDATLESYTGISSSIYSLKINELSLIVTNLNCSDENITITTKEKRLIIMVNNQLSGASLAIGGLPIGYQPNSLHNPLFNQPNPPFQPPFQPPFNPDISGRHPTHPIFPNNNMF